MQTPVGKVGKVFGQDGSVLLNLYDSFPDEPDIREPLYVRLDGLAVPLFFESFERRGKGALVRFMDIDNPDRAALIVGEELFMAGEQERDFDDITGWNAVAEGLRGTVTGYVDSAMNPLLEVDFGGGEVLVPVAFVENADPETRTVTLLLPEGLLDLNV
jgi:16S rRNA processing protein RimM